MKDFLVNALALMICRLILPRLYLHQFSVLIYRKNLFLHLALGSIVLIICAVLFQSKMSGGIQADMFLFAIPVIVFLLTVIQKWLRYQTKAKDLGQELQAHKESEGTYQELLDKVRVRQHDFNNQITAILSTHYLYKTYEDIVRTQKQYCSELIKSNKYNRLL